MVGLQIRFNFDLTVVRLLFDRNSAALRSFDDLKCYDRRHIGYLLWAAHWINKQASVTAAAGYVTVTLMTYD